MKALLIKDLILNKKANIALLAFSFFIVVIMAIFGTSSPDGLNGKYSSSLANISLSYGEIAPLLLAMNLFMDEKCGFRIQAYSSPATRREYMKAKYLFSILNIAAIFAALSVILLVGILSVDTDAAGIDISDLIILTAVSLGISIISCTFLICFSEKLGAGKSIVLLYIIMCVFLFAFGLITSYVMGFADGSQNPAIFQIYSIILIAVLAVTEIIMVVKSFKWAERKEL